MAVIALTSASGSPGVTTTALGLALSRSRPTILLDADPTGGSPILAGYLQGQMVPPDALVELAVAQQQGRMRDVLPSVTLPLPDSQVALVPGPRSHTQAGSLGALWDPLLSTFKQLASTGQDAVVDLGRLGLTGSASPFLTGSDLLLVTCRSDLVALSGARSWVASLKGELEHVGAGAALGIVLIGEGRPFTAREVAQVLGVPVLSAVAWDPAAAAAFSAGAQVRKLARSALVRSLRTLETAITSVLDQNRDDLHVGQEAL